MKFCTSCGAENTGKPFCTTCGKPMPAAHAAPHATPADAPTTVLPPRPAETRTAPPRAEAQETTIGLPTVEPASPVVRESGGFWTRARLVVAGVVALLLVGGGVGAAALIHSRRGEDNKVKNEVAAPPKASPTEAPTTASAGGPTQEVDVDPFKADGTLDPSYRITDTGHTVTCDGGSPFAKVGGTAYCGDRASDGAVACWSDPDKSSSVLCLAGPWDKSLNRFSASGLKAGTPAASDPMPVALELADGSRCFAHTGAAAAPEGFGPGWDCQGGGVGQVLLPAGDPEWYSSDDNDTWYVKANTGTDAPQDLAVTKAYWMSGPTTTAAAPSAMRACMDGSKVPVAETCDVTHVGALRVAFGVKPDEACGPPRDPGAAFSDPVVNFDCGDVHYAKYLSEAKRADRLRDYGSDRGQCSSDVSAGTVLCGPNRYGRYVRTYSASSGILLYASSTDRSHLEALPMLTADTLLHGAD